jgi:hypothetical protein
VRSKTDSRSQPSRLSGIVWSFDEFALRKFSEIFASPAFVS